jgi:hypothetical protein
MPATQYLRKKQSTLAIDSFHQPLCIGAMQ